MNNFDNNLMYIEKYNAKLTDKLKAIRLDEIITNFNLENSINGEINLLYKNIHLHNEQSPINEAKVITGTFQHKSEHSITILLGLGLGYLLKETFNQTQGQIIIYEPNIDILRFTLESVDFEDVFKSEKTFIVNDFIQLKEIINKIYSLNSKINLNGLTSFTRLNPNDVNTVSSHIQAAITEINNDYITLFEKGPFWAKNSVKNIKNIINHPDVLSLKDLFSGKPAVIVSSGPSLDDHIETLKINKDKVIIFATGNSATTLINNGIKPDFICFIDNNDNTAQVVDVDISNVNIIAQPTANPNVFNLNSKRKFVFYTENDLFSRWMKKIGDFNFPEYDSKGTVSYCACISAIISGCNPIILMGQDLAYTKNKCYASSSAYGGLEVKFNSETEQYEINITDRENLIKHYIKDELLYDTEGILASLYNQVKSNLTTVKGQDGRLLATSANYKSFIYYFEEFAQTKPSELKLYNSSLGGAQIEGFENRDLLSILADFPQHKIDKEAKINDALNEYKLPIEKNIQTELTGTKELITKYMNKARTLIAICESLEVEAKRKSLNLNKIRKNTNLIIDGFLSFQENLFGTNNFLTYPIFKELATLNNLINSENVFDDLVLFSVTNKVFYSKFILEYEQILPDLSL